MESSIRLTCDVRSVPEARHFVTETVHRWNGPIDLSDAELLTSEVVTNALIHGGTEVVLAVRFDPVTSTITVEVHDAGQRLPIQPANDPYATSGRGLSIIDHVADSWGVTDLPGDGKVVWFALRGH